MQGLFENPAFMAGMGLLSSNAPSLTPQNPMQSVMSNLMQGSQLKRQSSMQDLQRQKIEAEIAAMQAPKERKIIKGADGYNYYQDDMSRVLPNVQAAPEKGTTAMQNAAMLFPNDINAQRDYINKVTTMSKAPVVNTNMNLPPNMQISGDYVVTQDQNGMPVMTVIPGSETDIKNKTANEKKAASQESSNNTALLQVDTIAKAIEKIQENPELTAGFFGSMFSRMGGTEAKDVSALLDTVKANISFDYLQSMRNNSPTGGALGQVSERELSLLGATAGSLDQAQSADQLIKTLKRLDKEFLEVIHGKDAAKQILEARKPKEKVYTYNPETGMIE